MTSALYLEHYLDSLEHLPIELQRNFTLMRDLDSRAQGLMQNIDSLSDNFLRNQKTISPEEKKEQLFKIQSLFNKAKEYGDDKVQLAIQTYELVDKHIRRLDNDLARFESEIQDKALNSRNQDEPSVGKSRKKTKDGKTEKKKRPGNSSEEDSTGTVRGTKKKKQKGAGSTGNSGSTTGSGAKAALGEATDSVSVLPGLAGIAHPSDVLDMPVDPNEPTYCLCHQVSYGEMIGCDNPDCPIEWFHFACVGLTTKPKGKWYCPKCTQDRKKK
ncbi:inhibitor of growth protein 5 isoform X2 [Tribolium castaneum]|uniref:inhibitor of growth protein 5 isoform X2 n=1 Tax=Tribolium castaneum TaxID=7070 RepID=UPI00046BEBF7|nr:PREDICTED: inhibitor of growth protein 5 isoform X2 [Tribolium castaneum]|eukprot:XP_008193228.1 PREDICTED: inhibitor of growth protein 5 isoform X2 [Tribolium castaneum]